MNIFFKKIVASQAFNIAVAFIILVNCGQLLKTMILSIVKIKMQNKMKN